MIRCRDKQVRIKVREDRLEMEGGCDKMWRQAGQDQGQRGPSGDGGGL